MFGKHSTILYLGEREILGPFSAMNLDLCQKCFIIFMVFITMTQ